MKRSMHVLFFVAAVLFLFAALAPLLRGRSVHAVFLSSAVLWLILGLVARKHARSVSDSGGEETQGERRP